MDYNINDTLEENQDFNFDSKLSKIISKTSSGQYAKFLGEQSSKLAKMVVMGGALGAGVGLYYNQSLILTSIVGGLIGLLIAKIS